MKFSPGEIKLHSSLSDTGETEESLNVTYDGPTVEVGFNAQYLGDFLRAVTEEQVAFHFRDAGSAGELRPAGDDVRGVYESAWRLGLKGVTVFREGARGQAVLVRGTEGEIEVQAERAGACPEDHCP